MRAFASSVTFRSLLGALLALALLFAPALASAAAAHIAVPDHQMQMMETGHCKSVPSSHDDKSDGKSCCISMCMAVAIAPSVPADAPEARHDTVYFVVAQAWHGFLGEIATPPPRTA
jgi:hypothetical protein